MQKEKEWERASKPLCKSARFASNAIAAEVRRMMTCCLRTVAEKNAAAVTCMSWTLLRNFYGTAVISTVLP